MEPDLQMCNITYSEASLVMVVAKLSIGLDLIGNGWRWEEEVWVQ